ncbi:MAG: SOS response-associated peptidase [Myxococcota bacterium]|nr:SOS response-associated peptidase [Myxococcota bacterium]MEE2780053.1 SOS response-associated peptidase [Myxococcota bacterium]
MCGRFGLGIDGEELAELLQLELSLEEGQRLTPRYNIAPSQEAAVVRLDRAGRRRLHLIQWGLLPSWSRDRNIASKLINARSETAGEKPSFREALQRRRCLVPTDGFYEWKREGEDKRPHHIGRKDGGLLCFAGLWERWTDPQAQRSIDSFTILTTTPNQMMSELHHRMPVILDPSTYDRWLDRRYGIEEVAELMKPCPDDLLTNWPVSNRVNRPVNDDIGCRDQVESPALTR